MKKMDDLEQAKNKEVAQAQQLMREQVTFILDTNHTSYHPTVRQKLTVNTGLLTVSLCVQEQISWREISDLTRQLRSSEDIVADLHRILQQKNFELETLRTKVGPLILIQS